MTSPHPFAAWVERAQSPGSPTRRRRPRVDTQRTTAGPRVPLQRRRDT